MAISKTEIAKATKVLELNLFLIFTYKCNVMSVKKIFRDYKTILVYVLVPLLLGTVVGILTSGSTSNYEGIVPGFVFPIVWSILYILMGFSSYLVRDNKELINLYK